MKYVRKLLMKKQNIKQIIVTLLAATILTGCFNVGGDNAQSANASTNSINKNNQLGSNASPTNGATSFVFNGDIKLGGGYDIIVDAPRSNGIDSVGGDYLNTLLRPSKGQAYEETNPSTYSWASTDGSYFNNASASKRNGAVAIGAGWGSYSTAMKMAMEQTSSSFTQGFQQHYDFGVKISRKLYFPLGTAGEIQNARFAILMENPKLREKIDKINSQTSLDGRNAGVKEFYSEFGQYFVSSITEGYLGSETILLTQKSDSGDSSNSLGVSGEFSVPFAKSSISYSQANSSSYQMTKWAHSLSQSITPSDEDLRNMMADINAEFDSQITKITYSLSADKLTGIGSGIVDKVKSTAKEPSLPNLTFTAEKSKVAEVTKEGAITEKVGAIKTSEENINATIKAGESVSEDSVKQLNSRLADFMPNEKYDPGENSELFSPEQKLVIYNAYKLIADLSKDGQLSIARSKIDEKIADMEKVIEVNAKVESYNVVVNKEGGNSVFSNWLENVKFIQTNTNPSVSFDQWLETISSTQLKEYMTEWKEKYDPGNISSEEKPTTNISKKLALTANNKSTISTATSESSAKPVVLDFSLTPWSIIFPELLSSPVDDFTTITKYSIVNSILDYINDTNYLSVVKTFQPPAGVATTPDVSVSALNTYNETLKTLLSNLQPQAFSSGNVLVSTISFNGYTYDLSSDDSISALHDAVIQYIAASPLRTSEWYKAVLPYKEKNLINPSGVLVVATNLIKPTSVTTTISDWNLLGNVVTPYLDLDGNTSKFHGEYNPNNATTLSQQVVDNADASTESELHSIATMLPLIYKDNNDKTIVAGLFYSPEKVGAKLAINRKNVFVGFAGQDGSGASNNSYGIDLAHGVVTSSDASNLEHSVGYPLTNSYVGKFCGIESSVLNKNAVYTFPASSSKKLGVLVGQECYPINLYDKKQSIILFPLSSEIVAEIDNNKKGVKPHFYNFYSNSYKDLGALREVLGIK